MAFAFPYALFHLKQTETSELKSVIIIARSGEKSPSPESYFLGEDISAPNDELNSIGPNQLTSIGKERMYLLGKFLKLKYYHLLLNGNPRKLHVRSSNEDKCLESAQMLMAGLNPPKDKWIWSTTSELENWQPKAIQTTDADSDDLLAREPNCLKFKELEQVEWRNSSKYQQLLNEFKHDLQTMRTNTGLEFEDSLEMLCSIEDSLKIRKAFKENNVPAWYTSTLSQRLQHIADMTNENRFSSKNMQRLYVGRLLHEIVDKINTQIRLNQESLASNKASTPIDSAVPGAVDEDKLIVYQSSKKLAGDIQQQPNVFIYMTNKEKLSALLSSLKIYSTQPNFGSVLLIEVHYDPINYVHFLRLFTINSAVPTVLPEPLRVNPIDACGLDSVECEPLQFEQNLRHLMLDKQSWLEVCKNDQQPASPSTNNKLPLTPLINDNNLMITTEPTTTIQTTTFTTSEASPTTTNDELTQESLTTLPSLLEKLDENLIVGPSKANNQEDNDKPNLDNSGPTDTTQPMPEEVGTSPEPTMTSSSDGSSTQTSKSESLSTQPAITEVISNEIDTSLATEQPASSDFTIVINDKLEENNSTEEEETMKMTSSTVDINLLPVAKSDKPQDRLEAASSNGVVFHPEDELSAED